ncbi:hypothetical protein VNO80_25211 [Phaseolus coccineus]|uniref:Uncharacterized protein n=1 Tax=Phaseolus coccineus TaxID=3886 RepID=A0AAN9LTV2_PHACN
MEARLSSSSSFFSLWSPWIPRCSNRSVISQAGDAGVCASGVVLALPCLHKSVVFIVYMCILWFATTHHTDPQLPAKPVSDDGISPAQLQKLPSITAKDLLIGSERVFRLDDITSALSFRTIPSQTRSPLPPLRRLTPWTPTFPPYPQDK